MKKSTLSPALLFLLLMFTSGCTSTEKKNEAVGTLTLPAWFTAPSPQEMNCVPVSLRMTTPPHLNTFSRKYKLPSWVIYGTVRALGTKELIANGIYRSFTKIENDHTTEVVVDNIYYDVSMADIDSALQQISKECIIAENELKRREVLASHARRRFGAYILFSLKPNDTSAQNLLMGSGADDTPMEQFKSDTPADNNDVGWSETDTHYKNTIMGEIRHNDLFDSFRRTEENAIYDLSKNIMVKFSHMRKEVTMVANSTTETSEEVRKEEIRIRIRGLHVVRRKADLVSNTCVVTITVPKKGVTPL